MAYQSPSERFVSSLKGEAPQPSWMTSDFEAAMPKTEAFTGPVEAPIAPGFTRAGLEAQYGPAKPYESSLPEYSDYMSIVQKGDFNDDDIQAIRDLKDSGYSEEEAYDIFQKYRAGKIKMMEKGEQEQITEEAPVETPVEKPVETTDRVTGGTIGNIVGGAVAEVPKIAGEVGAFFSEYGGKINPFTTTEQDLAAAEFSRSAGEKGKEFIKKYGAYEPESTGAKVGETTADIGAAILGPSKFIKGAGILKGAARGALGMQEYSVVTEGKPASAGETAAGAVLGPVVEKIALPLIVKGLEKGAKVTQSAAKKVGEYSKGLKDTYKKEGVEGFVKKVGKDIDEANAPGTQTITREIPEQWIQNEMKFTPTERATIERIQGKTAPQYLLEKNLANKSKEELAVIFDKQSNDMYNGITEKLAKIPTRVESPSAKEAIQDMIEQLSSSDKLKRGYADDIAYLENLLKQADYSGTELNNIRRAFDRVNTGMYTTKGTVRSGAENAIDVRIRDGISNEVENLAEQAGFSVKEMNKELRTGITMKDAIIRSMSQEQKNNVIGLQDLGIMGVFSGGDPLTALALGMVKKGSEGVRPSIAQGLYNLNKSKNATIITPRGVNIPVGSRSSIINRPDSISPVSKEVKKPLVDLKKEMEKRSIKEANKPLVDIKKEMEKAGIKKPKKLGE